MSFQVILTNQLSGNVNLKMCDNGNSNNCSVPIGKERKVTFPNPANDSINQVKVSPTDTHQKMPDEWKIVLPKFGVTYNFVPNNSGVEIMPESQDERETIINLKNGTSDWALIIMKEGVGGVVRVEGRENKGIMQPTNVTVGDNWG